MVLGKWCCLFLFGARYEIQKKKHGEPVLKHCKGWVGKCNGSQGLCNSSLQLCGVSLQLCRQTDTDDFWAKAFRPYFRVSKNAGMNDKSCCFFLARNKALHIFFFPENSQFPGCFSAFKIRMSDVQVIDVVFSSNFWC
jgi:hypothetical protein